MGGIFADEAHFPSLSLIDRPRKIPNCGTVACIAGHVLAIANGKSLKETRAKEHAFGVIDRAARRLGVNRQKANRLFYMDEWPKRFRFDRRSSPARNAVLAAKRIDYFIKTGK